MENIIQKLGGFLNLNGSRLSLSIEGMSLKLLVCQEDKILSWSITPINPGFLSGGFISAPEKLAGVIKTAIGRQGFSGKHRVLASLPAFHSISRPLQIPTLKEVRPDVAIPQQARRDFGYAETNSLLFWQFLETADSHHRYLVLSVPKEPVITLIKTLKQAGIKPSRIETNTFALSRAVNESHAIIAAVEPNSLDSIILIDGMPLSHRSTFWGETPVATESLPAMVADALERIISFHNDSNPSHPLPAGIPVYLLGSAGAANPDIAAAVETTLERPVTEFKPSLTCPPDFPKAEMAVNIGLILREL